LLESSKNVAYGKTNANFAGVKSNILLFPFLLWWSSLAFFAQWSQDSIARKQERCCDTTAVLELEVL
jgi:hypothetical protein